MARPDLFTVGSLRAVELDRDGLPALQRFFEANRDYFVDVEGHGPADDEACARWRTIRRRGCRSTVSGTASGRHRPIRAPTSP